MASPLFSIIVPVYNVEEYLAKCVESILGQTFQDFELILVDDGSPDNCPALCDELAQSNSKIKVIHKQNGGSSDARNVGTSNSSGAYIIYLDSDDKWVDYDGLRAIYNIIDRYNPDIVVFGVEDYNPITGNKIVSRGNYNESSLNTKTAGEVVDTLIADNNFPGAAWMLAVRRKFVESNRLSFIKGITAEDFDWIIKAFSMAESIKVLDRIIYQYRYTSEGSITSRPRVSGIIGIHTAISNWRTNHKNSEFPSISHYLCGVYMQALLNYDGLDKEDKEVARQYVLNSGEVLYLSKKLRDRMLRLLLNCLGTDFTAHLITKARNFLKR